MSGVIEQGIWPAVGSINDIPIVAGMIGGIIAGADKCLPTALPGLFRDER